MCRLALASAALIAAATGPAFAQTLPTIVTPPPMPVERDAQGCWASPGPNPATGVTPAFGMDERMDYWVRVSGKDWHFADKAPVSIRVRAVDIPNPAYGQERTAEMTIEARGFLDKRGRSGVAFPLAGPGYNFTVWSVLSLYRQGETTPFAVVDNSYGLAARSIRPCLMELAGDDRGSGKPVVTKVALRNPGTAILTDDDYPAAALRAEEQGRTSVRLTVSAHGLVSDCTVTASSGSAILDSTTCSILPRRLRLSPALDEAGQPTQGTLVTSITWRIPGSAPPAPAAPLPQPIRQ